MAGVLAFVVASAAVAVVVGRWVWRLHVAALGGVSGPARSKVTGSGSTGTSVLIWRRIRLLSVLSDDTTAILACRAAVGSRPSPTRQRPTLTSEDRTIVLHLGCGEDGERALVLLRKWCDEGAAIRVGPTPLAGTIELADDRGLAALHAPLAAI